MGWAGALFVGFSSVIAGLVWAVSGLVTGAMTLFFGTGIGCPGTAATGCFTAWLDEAPLVVAEIAVFVAEFAAPVAAAFLVAGAFAAPGAPESWPSPG